MSKRRRISMVRWVISFIILVPILTVWSFFLTGHWKTFKVISRSMQPTLMVNDCLIMREQTDFPILDDKIVVLRDPEGGTFPIVKRVIASANSTVKMRNGNVYLGESSDPVPGETIVDSPNQTWTLDESQVFVLGDNRNNSEDSTDFGPLPRADILGVITWCYWPLNRFGAVD